MPLFERLREYEYHNFENDSGVMENKLILERIGTYKNRKLHGRYVIKNLEDRVRAVHHYRDGILHGKLIEIKYMPTGELKSREEYTYVDGKKDGPYFLWNKSVATERKWQYRGISHGDVTIGKKLEDGEFKYRGELYKIHHEFSVDDGGEMNGITMTRINDVTVAEGKWVHGRYCRKDTLRLFGKTFHRYKLNQPNSNLCKAFTVDDTSDEHILSGYIVGLYPSTSIEPSSYPIVAYYCGRGGTSYSDTTTVARGASLVGTVKTLQLDESFNVFDKRTFAYHLERRDWLRERRIFPLPVYFKVKDIMSVNIADRLPCVRVQEIYLAPNFHTVPFL